MKLPLSSYLRYRQSFIHSRLHSRSQVLVCLYLHSARGRFLHLRHIIRLYQNMLMNEHFNRPGALKGESSDALTLTHCIVPCSSIVLAFPGT